MECSGSPRRPAGLARLLTITTCVALCLVVEGPAAAADPPGLHEFSSTPNSPAIVVGGIADFDHDGNLDFLLRSNDGLNIAFGDGLGKFATSPSSPGTGPIGTVADIGDIDEDGSIDFVSSPFSSGSPLLWFGSTAIGIANSHSVSAPGMSLGDPLLRDFDGDGHLDIVAVRHFTTDLVLLAGDGAGQFAVAAASSTPTSVPMNLRFATDIDLDGDLDILRAVDLTTNPAVLYNDGAGSFTHAMVDPNPSLGFGRLFAVADFDNNGADDLLVGTSVGVNGPITSLSRLDNPGTGTNFTVLPATPFPTPLRIGGLLGPEAVSTAHLDADGRLDVVLVATAPTNVSAGSLVELRSSASSGSGFTSPLLHETPRFHSLELADFDHDSTLDAVAFANGCCFLSGVIPPPNAFRRLTGSAVQYSRSMDAVDFEGDGDFDLITIEQGFGLPTPRAVLNRNSGSAVFDAPEILFDIATTNPNVDLIGASDHELDGDADILFAVGSFYVRQFLNTGSGGFVFGSEVLSDAFEPTAIQYADVTGDGRKDIVRGTNSSQSLLVHPAAGSAFGTPITRSSQFGFVQFIAVGDLNHDGWSDIATLEKLNLLESYAFVRYVGNGASQFTADFSVVLTSKPLGLCLTDRDGDGDDDVAILLDDPTSDRALWIATASPAGLSPFQSVANSDIFHDTMPVRLQSADFNRDGFGDLVLKTEYLSSIYLGRADGNLDAGGIASLQGANDLAIADLDGDGGLELIAIDSPHFEIGIVHARPTALTVESYGNGKPGSHGIPVLSSLAAPLVGSVNGLRIAHGTAGAVPFLLFGAAPLALPFDLGTLLVSPTVIQPLPAFPANGQLDIYASYAPSAVYGGITVYFQALFVDPLAAGHAHTAQTNGLAWTLGL